MSGRGFTRREFLARLGEGAVFCGLVGTAGRLLPGCEVHEEVPRISGGLRLFFTPRLGESAEAATRGDQFFIQFGNPGSTAENHPEIDPAEWSLTIAGGATPVTLTMGDIDAEVAAGNSLLFLKTMRCVLDAPSETLIANAYWRGVPLHTFLARAQPGPEIQRVRFTAYDGFENNLRLSRVMGEDDGSGGRVFREEGIDESIELLPVVLAFEMNGARPIPSVHGGPVRVIVPEKFGYKNMKFPERIELTSSTEPFGEYEVRLFNRSPVTDLGNISLASAFSGPLEGEAVAGPRPDLFGIALYGAGDVTGVEVSIDGGEFRAAQIVGLEEILSSGQLAFGEETSDTEARLQALRDELAQIQGQGGPDFSRPLPYVWVLWQFTPDFDLSPGDHTAQVRAFGEPGNASQPETDTDLDDGNSRIRRVRFTVE